MRFLRTHLGALLAALVLLSLPAFAQLDERKHYGTVYDPTGATVPRATVVARNIATGVENTTKSTGAGDYRFENLPVGIYSITVNAAGFTKAEVANVNVQFNVTVTTNVTLGDWTSGY